MKLGYKTHYDRILLNLLSGGDNYVAAITSALRSSMIIFGKIYSQAGLSGWCVLKITKLYLNLLKLCRETFFRHGAVYRGVVPVSYRLTVGKVLIIRWPCLSANALYSRIVMSHNILWICL